jgi:hypothetical protein
VAYRLEIAAAGAYCEPAVVLAREGKEKTLAPADPSAEAVAAGGLNASCGIFFAVVAHSRLQVHCARLVESKSSASVSANTSTASPTPAAERAKTGITCDIVRGVERYLEAEITEGHPVHRLRRQ